MLAPQAAHGAVAEHDACAPGAAVAGPDLASERRQSETDSVAAVADRAASCPAAVAVGSRKLKAKRNLIISSSDEECEAHPCGCPEVLLTVPGCEEAGQAGWPDVMARSPRSSSAINKEGRKPASATAAASMQLQPHASATAAAAGSTPSFSFSQPQPHPPQLQPPPSSRLGRDKVLEGSGGGTPATLKLPKAPSAPIPAPAAACDGAQKAAGCRPVPVKASTLAATPTTGGAELRKPHHVLPPAVTAAHGPPGSGVSVPGSMGHTYAGAGGAGAGGSVPLAAKREAKPELPKARKGPVLTPTDDFDL